MTNKTEHQSPTHWIELQVQLTPPHLTRPSLQILDRNRATPQERHLNNCTSLHTQCRHQKKPFPHKKTTIYKSQALMNRKRPSIHDQTKTQLPRRSSSGHSQPNTQRRNPETAQQEKSRATKPPTQTKRRQERRESIIEFIFSEQRRIWGAPTWSSILA